MAVEYARGDVVALQGRELRARVRSGACTEAELAELVVVAVKAGSGVGQLLKLRTRDHASIGWVKAAFDVVLVRRG